MKISVIIATMMVAQVSASFLDVFQGAVVSVQNSFGKLFSDVVTDVKDTVDCTILAVEHVLSLSEDATARYYKKCGNAINGSQSDSQPKYNFPVLEISIANNEEYLKKELPEEIDARINATLSKFLNGYNPHDKLEDVQKELAKETERLADVSDLVRQELDKLSKEIHLDFNNVERKGYKPSVDTILDELKVLEAIEQNMRNSSEASEIHRLIDDVLNKLHEIEFSEARQNDKVDGILRDLEKSSNGSYKDIRGQLEDWKAAEARHLNVIKTKMDEHEKLPEHLEYVKINNTFATIEPKTVQDHNIPQNITTLSEVPINKTSNLADVFMASTQNVALATEDTTTLSVLSITVTYPSKQTTSSKTQYDQTEISVSTGKPSSEEVSMVSAPLFRDYDHQEKEVNDGTKSLLDPIKKKLASRMIPLSSKNSVDSIAPTTVTITESKFLNSKTKQFLSTPKIAIQQSPVQISDTLDVITPVPISTSSYVNEINVDVTETLNPQTIEEEPAFDYISDKSLDSMTPITTLEPSTSPSVITPEATTNPPMKTTKRTRSLQKAIPGITMDSLMTIPLTLSSPDTSLKITVTPLATTTMPTLDTLKTTLEPATSPQVQIPEETTNALETIIDNTNQPEPVTNLPMTADKSTVSPTATTEPTTSLPVTAPEPTTSFVPIPELTTDLPESTKSPITNLKLITSISEMDSDPTTSPTMTLEPTTSHAVTASEPTNSETTPESTTDQPMTATESTTNPATTSEPSMSLPVTALELTASPATKQELTTDLPESTTSPITTPKLITSISVTDPDSATSPTMTLEPSTRLTVTASEPTSSSTTPEPTTDQPMTDTDSTTNPATTPEHITSLPVTALEPTASPATNPELTTDLPESTTSPITTPELIMSISVTDPDPATSPTTTPAPTISLPETAPELTNSDTTAEPIPYLPMTATELTTSPTVVPEPTMYFPVTAPEPTTSTTTPESTTNLPVTTLETTSPATPSEPTTNLPVTSPELTTSSTAATMYLLAVVLEPSSAATTPKPTTDFPMTAIESITNLTTTPELTTDLPVTVPEPISSATAPEATTGLPGTAPEPATSAAMTPEPTMSLPVMAPGPTTSPAATPEVTTVLPVMAPGPTASFQMKVPEQSAKSSNTTQKTFTSSSVTTSESTTSPIETMSKSKMKRVTDILSNSQNLLNLPTHRPRVPTPSLDAFLNYIDRKAGITKPVIQSTEMPTTPVPTLVGAEVKVLPLPPSPYSKPLSDTNNDSINAQLNTFFSHIPPQNISPYARSDHTMSMNRTAPGVLGLAPPEIRHDIPLPYITNPSDYLNKNSPRRPLPPLLRHLPPQSPYNKPPNSGNINSPPLGKEMPMKRPQRRSDPIPPHVQLPNVRLTMNLNRLLGLTTNRPVPTPKTNNYDDADYKSFFHLPSKDKEAHNRALRDAKQVIEDSKRAHRVINNILNKKNKGISAFNFPKSLKVGK